jgi:hypothetical protein
MGHELVDKCPAIFLEAKPDEAHNIDMVDLANGGDLTDVLGVSSTAGQ